MNEHMYVDVLKETKMKVEKQKQFEKKAGLK